jgi:hypothetical protein
VGSLTSRNPVGLHGLLRGQLCLYWAFCLKRRLWGNGSNSISASCKSISYIGQIWNGNALAPELLYHTLDAKFNINLSVLDKNTYKNTVAFYTRLMLEVQAGPHTALTTSLCNIHHCLSLCDVLLKQWTFRNYISVDIGSPHKRSPLICRLQALCWTEIKFRATIVSTKRLPWLPYVLCAYCAQGECGMNLKGLHTSGALTALSNCCFIVSPPPTSFHIWQLHPVPACISVL